MRLFKASVFVASLFLGLGLARPAEATPVQVPVAITGPCPTGYNAGECFTYASGQTEFAAQTYLCLKYPNDYLNYEDFTETDFSIDDSGNYTITGTSVWSITYGGKGYSAPCP